MNVSSGTRGADRDPLETADQTRIDAAKRALINAGRIDEAVTDHPLPGLDCRQDHVAHVIVARGGEQNGFGLGA